MDRDKIRRAPEELQLANPHARQRGFHAHRVQNTKVVARIFVELRSLVFARHVLQRELMEPKGALQPGYVLGLRCNDVYPDQVAFIQARRRVWEVRAGGETKRSLRPTRRPGAD